MNYKMYKPKKDTPITWFRCAYCGKLQWRRTSRIKNPDLIFCDNTCRAKYNQKKHYSKKINNSKIKFYRKKYISDIKTISARIVNEVKIPNLLNDLFQESNMAIYKMLQNNELLPRDYFCKFLYKHLLAYVYRYEFSNANYSIDFLNDKTLIIEDEKIYNNDLKIDSLENLKIIINEYPKMCASCKLVIEKEVLNKEDNYLMAKWNMNKRKLTYNLSQGKRILRSKYA